MGALIGIAIVGALIWATYAGYVRVLSSSRYATRQRRAPDLERFAEPSTLSRTRDQRLDGPRDLFTEP